MDYNKDSFIICGPEISGADVIAREQTSYFKDAWRRLKENKVAIISLIILLVLVFMVIFGPMISGYQFEEIDKTARNEFPSASHWFGTDKLGRDLFARVWVGGRVSISIALIGTAITTIIGCIYGGISAYFGGTVDDLMMRVVEVLIAIPYLIIVILVSYVMASKSIFTLIFAMTVTGWCGVARLVRSQMLSLRSQEFVMAANALGVKPWNIIMRHMIPNTISVVIVQVTFNIPGYIFSEAFLSFIGLGVQPPNTSWGALASAAQTDLAFYPYLLFFPVLMIVLTMLSFSLLGDGLRDALDPKLRK